MFSRRRSSVGAAVAGGIAGAAATYAFGVAKGHLPLWFGPDNPSWSRAGWNAEETELLETWRRDGYEMITRAPSTRNWVGENDPRRVTRQYAWHEGERRGRALVRYGADTEGPPRCVHGGCTASVVDSFMGLVAHKATRGLPVTANLNVNYRKFVPSGSTVQVEAWVASEDGRKVNLEFKVLSLDGATLHNDGTSLFVDTSKSKSVSKAARSVLPELSS